VKKPAIISAALASLLALAACGKSQSPDENPAPAAAPEPPYQSPTDTAPASPDTTMPPDTMTPPDATTPPTDQPSDTQSEPPQNPSG
jgi:hypothetical protein